MEINGYDYELILVNDGSDDGSDRVLNSLVELNPKVRVVTFRRRYGQTAALSAGFKYAKGSIIITMDGDLQNDPADIPRFMDKMSEGYDMVNGWRRHRQDATLTRTIPSRVANWIINYLIAGTCVHLNDYGCTLKAYKAGIVKNIKLYGEMHRFIPVFAAWLGVRMTEIEVNHRRRHSGKAKYNLSRVSRVILDLVVVRFFSDYGTRPIQFFGRCAKLLVQLGLLGMGGLLLARHYFSLPLSYSSIAILSGLIVFSGLQLIFIGLLGEITMRTYYESQSKDTYYIRDILEHDMQTEDPPADLLRPSSASRS
jgi:glycosyltransferase involved in cell wall biosynthesis